MKRLNTLLDQYSPFLLRVALGVLLIALGVNHARNFDLEDPASDFLGFITQPMPVWAAYPDVIPIAMMVLGWIFVVLLIATGILILTRQLPKLAHALMLKVVKLVLLWIAIVIAFGSFEVSLQAMQFALNPILILILYYFTLQFDTKPAAKKR